MMEMTKAFLYGAAALVFMHGLIHLMGFTTYWQLAEIKELPYKTALLNGQWEVGDSGIRLFGALWLIATVGFVAAAYGLLTQQDWWQAVMWGAALLSLALTALDWTVAFMGVAINIVILALLIIMPRLPL